MQPRPVQLESCKSATAASKTQPRPFSNALAKAVVQLLLKYILLYKYIYIYILKKLLVELLWSKGGSPACRCLPWCKSSSKVILSGQGRAQYWMVFCFDDRAGVLCTHKKTTSWQIYALLCFRKMQAFFMSNISTLQQDFVFQWLVELKNNKQASDGANGPLCCPYSQLNAFMWFVSAVRLLFSLCGNTMLTLFCGLQRSAKGTQVAPKDWICCCKHFSVSLKKSHQNKKYLKNFSCVWASLGFPFKGKQKKNTHSAAFLTSWESQYLYFSEGEQNFCYLHKREKLCKSAKKEKKKRRK